MEKFKNKNTVVLIISAALIVIAIVIAVIATTSSGKPKDSTTKPQVSLNAELIASLKDNNTDNDSTTSGTKSATGSSKAEKSNTSYTYEPGKYTVATKDDSLGLRIEPNTKSDRIIHIPKGEQVEVLAVWEDWGYVVYEKTGGWLSMNYLELVSGNSSSN